MDAGCWCGGLSLAEAGAGFARAGLVRSRRGPHWARVWRSRLREGGGWALRGVQGFVPAGERVLVGRGDAREDRYPLKPLRCRCTAISPLRGPNPLPVPRSRVLADPCIYLYISFVHFHVWRRSGRVFTLRPKRYSVRVTAAKAAERLEPDPTRRMVRSCEACPPSARSRRTRPARSTVTRRMAKALDLPVERVKAAYDAAVGAGK